MAGCSFDLSGRVALVTGGNGGIGRAIALAFAEARASVAIIGRNEDKNRVALRELQDVGAPSLALRVDVGDRVQLGSAVENVERSLGPVSILVNNAGIAMGGSLLTLDPVTWDNEIATNLTAPFLLSRYAAKSMIARRRGKIINICSASIAFGNVAAPSYTVTKGALAQLTKCLAVELAPFNVQVNGIAPGWTVTEMTRPLRPMLDEQVTAQTPAGRWAAPEDIAGTAVFLASSASDWVTGTVIFADGGFATKQPALDLQLGA
jgi:NAD(P)-dependent dehydrogenase (short-subunit alcohol dehydrogenase family)